MTPKPQRLQKTINAWAVSRDGKTFACWAGGFPFFYESRSKARRARTRDEKIIPVQIIVQERG